LSYKCPLCNPFTLLFLVIGLTLMFFKTRTLAYLGLTLIVIAYIYPIFYSILNLRKNKNT